MSRFSGRNLARNILTRRQSGNGDSEQRGDPQTLTLAQQVLLEKVTTALAAVPMMANFTPALRMFLSRELTSKSDDECVRMMEELRNTIDDTINEFNANRRQYVGTIPDRIG